MNHFTKTLVTTIILSAMCAKAHAEDTQTLIDYCTSTGGTVIDMIAKFETKSGKVDGFSKSFCQYDLNGHLNTIGLDTLASTLPSLAATYTQKVVIDSSKTLPMRPYGNPGLDVCHNLNGISIAFSAVDGGSFLDADGGEADVCVFADGSMISGWSLIYMANDPNQKALIHSTPLDIDIPIIYIP